jgi:hypothetical protein
MPCIYSFVYVFESESLSIFVCQYWRKKYIKLFVYNELWGIEFMMKCFSGNEGR